MNSLIDDQGHRLMGADDPVHMYTIWVFKRQFNYLPTYLPYSSAYCTKTRVYVIFLDPILLSSLLLGFIPRKWSGLDSIPELKRGLDSDLSVWQRFSLVVFRGDNFCALFNSYPAVLTFNTHQVQEGVIGYLTLKKPYLPLSDEKMVKTKLTDWPTVAGYR